MEFYGLMCYGAVMIDVDVKLRSEEWGITAHASAWEHRAYEPDGNLFMESYVRGGVYMPLAI